MNAQDRETRLDRLLGELGSEDVPAGFTDRAMARIDRDSGSGKTTSKMFKTGGRAMRKNLMWGLATAAAILLAYFAVRGFPDVGQGSEATIGAAKRYQAPQIQGKDVVLGDQSVQQFMQSDVFDRLLKDPAAVKALSDASLRLRIADASIAQALTDPQLVALLKSYGDAALHPYGPTCPGCQLALESADVQAALQDESFANALGNAGFISALQDAKISAGLAQHDLEAALTRVELQAALKAPISSAALQNANFLKAITNAQFVSAIRDQQFRQAIQNPAFLMALSNAKLAAAIQSPSFQAALRVAGFNAALRAESFANAMQVSAANLAQ